MSISKPQKSIIFNKYRIKKLIAKTHFGWLYEVNKHKRKSISSIENRKKDIKI